MSDAQSQARIERIQEAAERGRANGGPRLEAFLAGGGRKIDAWYATLATVEVPFDDEANAFRNINTRDELAAADGS